MLDQVVVGLLASTCGTYSYVGRSILAGLRHAIAEINADPAFDFTLDAREYDPEGELQNYITGVDQLLGQGARHIFGTTTSSSRKEIIPDLERTGSLLWYPCPYEGYECSQNVLYLGACPSQNLLPLLSYAISGFGPDAYLIGSNYIWGWESNRIARELLELADGTVHAEKYYRFGDTDFDTLIDGIIHQRPSFILNNLVGESSYHFLNQLNEACREHGLRLPVLSCNFTESELAQIQTPDAIQLLSCGAFFEGVDPDFVAGQHRRHGIQPISHCYTTAYVSMHLFANAVRAVGHDHPEAISETLANLNVPTVLGRLQMSEHNNHFALPCHIAEAGPCHFRLVHTENQAIPADPYLVQSDFDAFRNLATDRQQRNFLRLVK